MPTEFVAVLKKELSFDSLKPDYVRLYPQSFTQEELDGMIAFYKTPSGAAVIDKMPLVMQKSQSIVQARLPALMQKMKAVTDKAEAKIKSGK